MSRTRLRRLESHSKLVEDHDDPKKLPIISRTFGIIKTMELVTSDLHDRLGISKVPLSYVISENVQPAPVELPVTNRLNGPTYPNIME